MHPRRHRTLGLACAMVCALFLTASCGSEDKRGPAGAYPTEAPVTWDKFFDAHDAAALAAEYSEAVMSMPYNAPTVTGRAAVQAEFEKFFAQNEGATHKTRVEEVLEGQGWAIERAAYTLTFTPKGQSKYVVETGRHVMCRKIENGRWQIVWELWNSDQPAPAPGATTADAGTLPPPLD